MVPVITGIGVSLGGLEKDKCVNSHPKKKSHSPSITEKLFGVVVMRPILAHTAFTPGEEVSTEKAVEINQDHYIHQYHGAKEISTMVQPGVIVHDVPGEVELGAQTKCNVGEEVG